WLYVGHLNGRHVRCELDHWGVAPLASEPIAIEPGSAHRVVVSLGSLFPPIDDPYYLSAPDARVLHRWLYVRLDDRVVFSRPFSFYDAEPEAATFGQNMLGFTSAGAAFTGELRAITRRLAREVGLGAQTLTWPPVTGTRLP